jgi:membrane-associated protein
MDEAIINLVEELVTSPWMFAILFSFAAVDAFLPAVPSESLVITAGVFAASGEPNLALVILAAALGAFAGDHVSYYGGRRFGAGAVRRAKPGSRSERAFSWADRALERRGGLILVVARYIPGARTATTLTAGAVHYPRPLFTRFDAIAAITWAAYSALIGYVGGSAFEDDPLLGLAAGLGLALAVTLLVEIVRRLRRQPSRI